MSPKIIVHCLIKNEERFIWYSLNSVLPFVDKMMVWDTGSTDKTVVIVKTIRSSKITFKEVGNTTVGGFPEMRQRMLQDTPKDFDWLMILDGDEIWPVDSIKSVVKFVRSNPKYESIVVRTKNLVGDIYHFQPDSAGQYSFKGEKGHLALRFINLKKIPGLHVKNPYGQEGYFDEQDHAIQNRDQSKIKLLNSYYLHATHLRRSSKDSHTAKRSFKLKYELGKKMDAKDLSLFFPESIPANVPKVIQHRKIDFAIIALIATPLRFLRRLLLPMKTGY